MKKTMTGFVLGAMLAVSLPAWAHIDEYFDSVAAPHGGQLRMVGPYHLELVTKDKEITLYVTDHADNKINTDGGLGKATIETGQTRTQIGLHPVGDNMLKGSGVFSVTPDTVIIVFIRLLDQEAHSVRFIPLKPKNTPAEKTRDGTPQTEDGYHHHHHTQH
ncbi:MAG: hypothetical protein EWM72_02159 [Nitrospira sp.]|nr:MAG: hypothetical protein EWM72_02159 [Nitrospira sp.]